MKDKVLVVALDGMDKELVKQYGIEFFTENEDYGPVDTSFTRYTKTNEIFASFITGRVPEKHGVYALNKWDHDMIGRFEHWSGQYKFFRKWKGIRGLCYEFLGLDSKRWYREKDIQTDTIFDSIDKSKPLFIPSFNPEPSFCTDYPASLLNNGFTRKEVRDEIIRNTRNRASELFDLTEDFWDFVMVHFHDPDMIHHLEFEDYERDYDRLAELCQEIEEKFEDWKIIYFSDHGLPEGLAHRPRGFYSANFELFEDKESPSVTDFRWRIEEILE